MAVSLSHADETFFLLDDFSGDDSQIGGSWEGFTDQVMGGISEISIQRLTIDAESFIRMTGDVSLENNGGFIQIRLILSPVFKTFDGSVYKGLRLKVRGRNQGYYIFLRTSSTVFPWKFYKSEINVEENWTVVDLPWSSFTEGDYGRLRPLNPGRLKSLALVAYGREFRAQIDLSEIGFYK